MKRNDHAVWGNCSAKWLFPSHCQAASFHINGRPGYLSGTHINLGAYRHRAGRRSGVVLLLPIRNVLSLSPQALLTLYSRGTKLQPPFWRLVTFITGRLYQNDRSPAVGVSWIFVLGFKSIHQEYNWKASVIVVEMFDCVWEPEKNILLCECLHLTCWFPCGCTNYTIWGQKDNQVRGRTRCWQPVRDLHSEWVIHSWA